MRANFKAIVRFGREHPTHYRLMEALQPESPPNPNAEALRQLVERPIGEMTRVGEDVELLRQSLWGALAWVDLLARRCVPTWPGSKTSTMSRWMRCSTGCSDARSLREARVECAVRAGADHARRRSGAEDRARRRRGAGVWERERRSRAAGDARVRPARRGASRRGTDPGDRRAARGRRGERRRRGGRAHHRAACPGGRAGGGRRGRPRDRPRTPRARTRERTRDGRGRAFGNRAGDARVRARPHPFARARPPPRRSSTPRGRGCGPRAQSSLRRRRSSASPNSRCATRVSRRPSMVSSRGAS